MQTTDDRSTDTDNRRSFARTSRLWMLGGIVALALVIGGVLWTSERDGPGSAQFTAASSSDTTSASQPTPEGGCVATATMPGGRNNYVQDAPMVADLGTGLVVSGIVREAGTCQPVRNVRIQIWLNTERGGEGHPTNRGSVLTDENGYYRLETSPVAPQFGQPHVHIGYDDGAYGSLFLRSVMPSKDVPTYTVDFVLAPNAD